ncbi:hypothetical protein [Archangium sp.]|uniref:hypothetical protein n=1 Tax=Archangium sp. TaxID=1872627 RepID=UPI00286A0778|nr:hypothetical protein [Archangium sp.]
MNTPLVLRSTLCGLLLSLTACQLLKTEDSENSVGRGSTAFDPYAASASGAIKLGLQMFNGCAILANGQVIAKGAAPIADYPAQCTDPMAADPTHDAKVTPTARFELMTDTNYFLNQLTLMDSSVNVFKNPKDVSPAVKWITTQSRFKNLDWTDLGQQEENWSVNDLTGTWNREVAFHNARWMVSKSDSFLVEVLDTDGTVRQSITYSRGEFLGESPVAGHTRVAWRVENIAPPLFPGDTEVRSAGDSGPLSFPITYRTVVRVDMVGSTNPFKSFRVTGLKGDGAIRVTWSLLPKEPFLFPVTFVSPQEVPPSCFKDDGTPAVCGFGVEPEIKLSTPKNGQFYVPGETFDMYLNVRDGERNLLHAPSILPSYSDFFASKTNGLLYFHYNHFPNLQERDISSSYQLGGPVNDLKPWSDLSGKSPFFSVSNHFNALVIEAASLPLFPGLTKATWPNRVPVTLPLDAKPGTYVATLRANRQFMGERVAKGITAFFQVGQTQKTTYPNEIGNCQICHRGVLSLDNLRHGYSVDDVESCKLCHQGSSDTPGRMQVEMHQLHMRSPKYSADKADCTICHLTKQSAVRPSVNVCTSCHPTAHGDEYFKAKFGNSGTPGRFSNCAQTCHVDKTPSNHILPKN